MPEIQPIGTLPEVPRGRLFFIHGLDGDAKTTWTNSKNEFWPEWLAIDFPEIAFYSIHYDAGAVAFLRDRGLTVKDRAKNLLEYLSAAGPWLDDIPTLFIAHSMGGLVVKAMLRLSQELAQRDDKSAKKKAILFRSTKGVLFLATPHLGSRVANWVEKLPFGVGSDAITSLVAGAPENIELHNWYIEQVIFAHSRQTISRVYCETRRTLLAWIVTRETANLPGVDVIPIDDNHRTIAKAAGKQSLIYAGAGAFVCDALNLDDARRARFHTALQNAPRLPRTARLAIKAGLGILVVAGGATIATIKLCAAPPFSQGDAPKSENPASLEKPNEPTLPARDDALDASEKPYRPRLIPLAGGYFKMGLAKVDDSPEHKKNTKKWTQHGAEIGPFAICRSELTLAHERAINMAPDDLQGACIGSACGEPISLTWSDSARILNKMTAVENRTRGANAALTACYDDKLNWIEHCTGYRLPTEAEWEYAARAGTMTLHSFPATEELCAYANAKPCNQGRVIPPCQLHPNGWGLCDMHGNIAEWVWDWFDFYPAKLIRDYHGPDTGKVRVSRGGSFGDTPFWVGSAARGNYQPDAALGDMHIGVRCARTLSRSEVIGAIDTRLDAVTAPKVNPATEYPPSAVANRAISSPANNVPEGASTKGLDVPALTKTEVFRHPFSNAKQITHNGELEFVFSPPEAGKFLIRATGTWNSPQSTEPTDHIVLMICDPVDDTKKCTEVDNYPLGAHTDSAYRTTAIDRSMRILLANPHSFDIAVSAATIEIQRLP